MQTNGKYATQQHHLADPGEDYIIGAIISDTVDRRMFTQQLVSLMESFIDGFRHSFFFVFSRNICNK